VSAPASARIPGTGPRGIGKRPDAKIKPNSARKCLVITNVADMVFAAQTFRGRLGVGNRYHHSATPVPAMPDEKSGPIVQNQLAHCVALAAKQVERSNIWPAEEILCPQSFIRGQITMVHKGPH
jgi:hypothetical protein